MWVWVAAGQYRGRTSFGVPPQFGLASPREPGRRMCEQVPKAEALVVSRDTQCHFTVKASPSKNFSGKGSLISHNQNTKEPPHFRSGLQSLHKLTQSIDLFQCTVSMNCVCEMRTGLINTDVQQHVSCTMKN